MAEYMANIGAGLASGVLAAPEYGARVQEARTRAEASKLQLDEYKANAPVREQARDTELSALQNQLYQTNAALAKSQTYDAFRKYDVDGDPKHLNQWLEQARKNPVASSTTGNMVRLDRLSRTPESEKLLQAAGVQDLDGFFSDPSLYKSMTLGTQADGSQALVDMNKMYAVSGYAQQATDEQLNRLSSTAKVMAQLRQGGNLQNIKATDALVGQVAEASGLPRAQVYSMLREEPKRTGGVGGARAGGGTAFERVANQIKKENPEMSMTEAYTKALEITKGAGGKGSGTNEDRFVQDYMSRNPDATREDAVVAYKTAGKDERTAGVKNIEYAEDAQKQLDEAFGGDFLSADLSNATPQQEHAMNKMVNRMEQVGGLKLTPDERKNARNIKTLVNIGERAGKLTDADTGILDSTYRTASSYISNNLEGKDATQAYNLLHALSRNAIFGSQVSSADYKAANKYSANLGQQTGPVLSSLRQDMTKIRDDLQATADLNDPYVAKARFGVTIDKLDQQVESLNKRIDLIGKLASGKTGTGATDSGIRVNATPSQPGATPAVPSGERPPLSDIFGGQ